MTFYMCSESQLMIIGIIKKKKMMFLNTLDEKANAALVKPKILLLQMSASYL